MEYLREAEGLARTLDDPRRSGWVSATEHVCRKLMQSLHGQATHEPFGLQVFPAVMARGHLARACAERAVTLARGRDERGYEAWTLRLLGELAAQHARPDVATAATHYGAAMTLASELEMRPLVAHCHRGLGMLYAATGQIALLYAQYRIMGRLYAI